jgi:uncharacterized coiled-coil DUF342 family protein
MGESIMNTTQYFDSIHEQLDRVDTKLKEINATIDMLMEEMVEMGWMEKDEENDMGEINKSRNDITQLSNHKNITLTYDVDVKYNTK